MSMYTSGIRKILFQSNAATDRDEFFEFAQKAGYRTVAWNSEIWVRVSSPSGDSFWHCTLFQIHDFRVVVDTE